MISWLIELLEGLKAAGDFAQAGALVLIIAIIIVPFFWVREQARNSILAKQRIIAKQVEQIQLYKVTSRAYDAEIEQLQRLLIEYLLESIDRDVEDLNEERVYVLCKDLIDRLTPAMDQACSNLAFVYTADIPLSGEAVRLQKIRQAEIVNRLYGKHFDQITKLLHELCTGKPITNWSKRGRAKQARALNVLALSRGDIHRE